MRKLTLSGLFILLWGALSWAGLPWWNTAIAGFLAAYLFRLRPGAAFGIGFSAGALLWWGSAMLENAPNGGMLAARVGAMLKGLQSWHLLTITALLGGLLAGLGSLLGSQVRDIFQKK